MSRIGGRWQTASVVTPDVPNLPFEMDNGVKVFNLIAEPVKQSILPGKIANLWGYNGSAPGPTIQVTQGDRVRIIVDNHLPEPTSMHWHGFEIPIDMDGGAGICPGPDSARRPLHLRIHAAPGRHVFLSLAYGHAGNDGHDRRCSSCIRRKRISLASTAISCIILQEYAMLPNNTVPNTLSMEFNWLTFNGKAGPATTPLIVRLGDRVRIRLVNLGMDHHPIHLHGHQFLRHRNRSRPRAPEQPGTPQNTVLVGVAQARDIEFDANISGRLDAALPPAAPHDEPDVFDSSARSLAGQGTIAGAGMEEREWACCAVVRQSLQETVRASAAAWAWVPLSTRPRRMARPPQGRPAAARLPCQA